MRKKIYSHGLKLLFLFLMCVTIGMITEKLTVEAAGSYYIQVNKGTNVVTVYKNNGEPYKAFICSTGVATPLGTYYTSQKLRWHELDGPTYGQYCTRITGHILFHSVWYHKLGDYASQSYKQYNKLGRTASHGCVRLTVADSKWIYDNCPSGTKVKIISGSSANDPLGKPNFIRVDESKYMGWDPTDPAPGNPYAHTFPTIETNGTEKNIQCGTEFDYKSGIVARDSAGNDITHSMTHDGTVNANKLGTYVVKYYVTDALHRSASASVTYHVVDNEKAVISGVNEKVTKEYKSTYKIYKKIKAYTADKKNITKKIKVKIKKPGSKTAKTYKKKTIKLTKVGTYKIYYNVTNPNNKKVTQMVTTLKVTDTKKPIFKGISTEKTATYNSVLNLKKGITAKLKSGKNMTSKITIKVKVPGSKSYKTLKSSGKETVNYKKYRLKKVGTYYIQYIVKNPYKKSSVAQKTMKLKVVDVSTPVLKGIRETATYEYNSVMNLRSGISAKMASGNIITDKIVVKVMEPGTSVYKELLNCGDASINSLAYCFSKVGTYKIEYSVANPNKTSVMAKAYTTVTIKDNAEPVILGVKESIIVNLMENINLLDGISASIPSQELPIASVIVEDANKNVIVGNPESFVFEEAGVYSVTYQAINPGNNKITSKTMQVIVKTNTEPDSGEESIESEITP